MIEPVDHSRPSFPQGRVRIAVPYRPGQIDLRSFAWGCIAGVVIWMGTLIAVSYVAGIKWQPVQSDWR